MSSKEETDCPLWFTLMWVFFISIYVCFIGMTKFVFVSKTFAAGLCTNIAICKQTKRNIIIVNNMTRGNI